MFLCFGNESNQFLKYLYLEPKNVKRKDISKYAFRKNIDNCERNEKERI